MLSDHLRNSGLRSAWLASAYLTLPGWKRLRPAIEVAVDRGRQVQLLVSIKDYFTHPDALEAALRLSLKEKRFQLRISRNPRFHAKAYLFDLGARTTALIGSANVTTGGMQIDGDLSLQVDAPSDSRSMISMRRWFADEFDEEHSRHLDQPLLDAYRKVCPKAPSAPPISAKASSDLHALLNTKTPEAESTSAGPNEDRSVTTVLWQMHIDGDLSPEAAEQLKTADWFATREPAVICFGAEPGQFSHVRKGHRVLVFDFSTGLRKGRMRPASVIETHDYPPTDDGRLFIVLKYARTGSKMLTTEFKKHLRAIGFGPSKKAFTWNLRRVPARLRSALRDEFGKAITG